LLFVMLHLKAN